MNPNQLKLNLKTMKAKKQDYKTRTIKYYNFFLDLKCELDNKENVSITNFIKKHKVSAQIGTFLIKNNVIFKDTNGYYNWNEKIPVTNLLIKKFRAFVFSSRKKITSLNNSKDVKYEPKLIKQRSKMNNIGKEETKVIYSLQKQEIGLIRKFLKWIY
jgi:hypothetical protein